MTAFVTADIPIYECADSPLERIWRETVGPNDLVYVIVGTGARSMMPQLDLLPGLKRLVAGVETVADEFVLSPLPIHPSQLDRSQVNLHARPPRPIAPDPQRLCVSLDRCGFRPVRLGDARLLSSGAALDLAWPAPPSLLEAAE
jgi:hypothetical protein